MNESESSQRHSLSLAIRPQEIPVHKKIGFHTAFGTEWFEFSPMKMKEYFYELGAAVANQHFHDDISFSTVLDMSSLNIDDLEDHPVYGSNLCAILDCKVKDDARVDMLKRVCGITLNYPEYEVLRHQINELVEADLVAANVKWNPEDDVFRKVRLCVVFLHTQPFIKLEAV
jgi:hypothetical protein